MQELNTEFFSLGDMPLVNNLNEEFEESLQCSKFPLKVSFSHQTGLTKLVDLVDSKMLFDKYVYISGTSKPFISHCDSMFDYLSKYINFEENDTLVDIGGNDGTLLSRFKSKINHNCRYINIDPSDISERSKSHGIEVFNEYFKESSSKKILNSAKLVVTTNVFQHLNEIQDFVKNLFSVLSNDGVWCLEFPYWYESMKTLQFDQIYHEHIYYYNVTPLNKLFNNYNLRIFNVSRQEIHGGSLRLLICREDSNYKTDETLKDILNDESDIDIEFYLNWKKKIDIHVDYCRKEIIEISKEKKIVAFGAAAKGCIFLNYSKLDYTHISYVIDDTETKKNKFVPGTGLKIYDRSKILTDEPDYILILAHNFKDYIIKSLREYGYKNPFIVCLPKFEIIT